MADYNAIFKKWNEQVSANSGFNVPCKFAYDIHAPMALHATIGVAANGGNFYNRIICDSRTYEAPWMERMEQTDIKENAYTLGTEANFDAVSGTFKRYNLDTQLSIDKTIVGIEKSTVPYDFAGWIVKDLARNLAIKSEDKFISNVITNGAKGDGQRGGTHIYDENMVEKDADGKVDFYLTVGHIIRTCLEQGWSEEDIVIYVSPKVAEKMMSKGLLLGNGAQSSAAFEFMRHKNQVGIIQNIPVIRVPRMSVWEAHATTPINMLVCNKSYIFKLEYLRTPLQLTPVTERHLDPSDRYIKCLTWLEWALKVENAAFFIDALDD